ncbi:MAG: hypothetical protein IKY44_02080 [Clostridia bacterium]|nr:hypothetical protein [Clostridia bacterium]
MVCVINGCKNLKIFLLGAATYPTLEIFWRGHTHWTMGVVGGACFVCICRLADRMHRCAMWKKCLAGTGAITAIEFVSGLIVNKKLGLGVWDYSSQPLNLLGQICLPYCTLWFLLCIPAFWLGEYINYMQSKNKLIITK